MKTFKPNSKMSHGGHYCWGGKVMKKAEGGGVTEAQRVGKKRSESDKAFEKFQDTVSDWFDFSPSGIGKKSNVDLSMDAAKAYMAKKDKDEAEEQQGYKRGGKVKPFWETKSPKKTSKPLTPSQKASAKARAAKAGRPYPNLIDNAAASRRGK